jgi:solute carrier family 25 ornithine transporter 2/15
MSDTPNSNDNADVLEPRAVTRDLFSASIGSILCAYTGQPLDTVKVKQQTNPEQFTSVLSTTSQIFQNEVRGA